MLVPKDDDDCCLCRAGSDVAEFIDRIDRIGMFCGGEEGCERGEVTRFALLEGPASAAALRPYVEVWREPRI